MARYEMAEALAEEPCVRNWLRPKPLCAGLAREAR
jgi:hypothetical protein